MGKFQSPEIQGLLRPFAAAQGDPAMLEQGGLLAPQGTASPTTAMRNLAAMGLEPGTPEYQKVLAALLFKPSNSVTVNNTGMPDLPKGYMWNDPANPSAGVTPLPGGPEDNSQKRDESAGARLIKIDSTMAEISKALPQINSWSAGPGSLLKGIPATDARSLGGALMTIKANIGFDELAAMRAASPTGGALGQVAVQELEALQASIASLDQGMKPEDLAANLQKVQQHYANWRRIIEQSRSGQDPNLSYPVPGAATGVDPAARLQELRAKHGL
jgi:hypothetical protein